MKQDQPSPGSEVQKLSEIVAKSKATSHYIAIISVIAVTIGFTVSIKSILHLTETQVVITDSLKHNIIVLDSIEQKEREAKKQEDDISIYVLEFLKAEKNDSNILKYYAPKLDVYYQKQNVPVEFIIKHKRRFINSYPKSKFVFEKDNIAVKIEEPGIAEVTANGLFYPDSLEKPKDILYKIKLTIEPKKIFYITNYTSTQIL